MKAMNTKSKKPVSPREDRVLHRGEGEPSPCLGIWGLWSVGHTVTSTVFFPANSNPAGEGRWTRIFYGEYEP